MTDRLDPPKRSARWMIDFPRDPHIEDYVLKTPMTEQEARRAYREDHNLQRLPTGTIFYPGSSAEWFYR